jgi:hypothetical protein
MTRFLLTPVSAVALLLAASGARADPSPSTVEWSYNFTPTMNPPAVSADGNPTANVTFTNEPPRNATGSSDVVATNLRVSSAAPGDKPDVLLKNGAYGLTLTLSMTDNTGTHIATLTFTGKLTGTFSAESSNLTNVFGHNATQTVSLGSFNFTVTMDAYTPPGPPDQTQPGAIGAHVSVTSANPTGGGGTPEPSTMLLSGLGLTFLGAAGWRKRRARARLAVA